MNKKNNKVDLGAVEGSLEAAYRTGSDPLALLGPMDHAQACTLFEQALENMLPHVMVTALSFIQKCEASGSVDTSFIKTGLPFRQVIDAFAVKGVSEQAMLHLAARMGEWLLHKNDLSTSYWLMNGVFEAGAAMVDDAVADDADHEQWKGFLEAVMGGVSGHPDLTLAVIGAISKSYLDRGDKHFSGQEQERFLASLAGWKRDDIISAYFMMDIERVESGSTYLWSNLLHMMCGQIEYPEAITAPFNRVLEQKGYNPSAFLFDLLGKVIGFYRYDHQSLPVGRVQADIMDPSIDKSRLARHMSSNEHIEMLKKKLNLDLNFIFRKEDLSGPIRRALLSEDLAL